MNSTERREARYQRRKAKREARRLARLERYNFDRVVSPDALWKAAHDSRRGVYWKASVQRYNMNLLRNSLKASKNLKAGADLRRGFICFDLVERGKLRHIQSVHFSERVVQRSLCSNALIPLLTGNLIHDNGASLANKGIDFALRRLKTHLRRHYKQHGTEGYVLLIDFKGYFDHILHDPIYALYRRKFGEDTRQRRKLKKFRKFLDAGDMTLEQIHNSYMSWRGFVAHKNARRTIHCMDVLYLKLFGQWPVTKPQKGG